MLDLQVLCVGYAARVSRCVCLALASVGCVVNGMKWYQNVWIKTSTVRGKQNHNILVCFDCVKLWLSYICTSFLFDMICFQMLFLLHYLSFFVRAFSLPCFV